MNQEVTRNVIFALRHVIFPFLQRPPSKFSFRLKNNIQFQARKIAFIILMQRFEEIGFSHAIYFSGIFPYTKPFFQKIKKICQYNSNYIYLKIFCLHREHAQYSIQCFCKSILCGHKHKHYMVTLRFTFQKIFQLCMCECIYILLQYN